MTQGCGLLPGSTNGGGQRGVTAAVLGEKSSKCPPKAGPRIMGGLKRMDGSHFAMHRNRPEQTTAQVHTRMVGV